MIKEKMKYLEKTMNMQTAYYKVLYYDIYQIVM